MNRVHGQVGDVPRGSSFTPVMDADIWRQKRPFNTNGTQLSLLAANETFQPEEPDELQTDSNRRGNRFRRISVIENNAKSVSILHSRASLSGKYLQKVEIPLKILHNSFVQIFISKMLTLSV